MYETTSLPPANACPYCSGGGMWVVHGGACPKITEIEYYPDGSVKRVRLTHTPRLRTPGEGESK